MSTILIVDDNKQGLYMLRVLLEGHGYNVASAANGVEALQTARSNRPDLVLSDILMPVMDGFTLCREWKRDKHLKKIPFVFYTAVHTDPRDQKLALDLGAERFIVKPSAPDKFIEQVKQVLEEHRRGSLVPSQKAPPKGEVFLQRYNEALVRKLEENILQLEETNRGLVQEIAERKRAEEALGVSEERYRLLIEHANEGVLVLQHGKVVFANRKAGEIAGYSGVELTSRPFAEFVPPDDRQMVIERYLSGLKGEKVPRVFDFRIIDKEGNTKWVEANGVVFTWEGRPAVLALITDITGRRLAEDQLRSSELRYRRLFESAEDGILILDADTGRIIDVNAFLTNLLGYSIEEFLGKNVWEISPFKDIALNQEAFQELQRKGYIRYEHLPLQTKDGRRAEVEFVSNAYLVDGKGVIQCNVRDITKRRMAEEALHKAQDRSQKYLDIAAVMLIALDEEGRIALINRKGCTVLGYEEAELLGKRWFDTCVPGQVRDEVHLVFQRLLAGEVEPVEYDESLVVTKEGGERIIAWHHILLRDETGRVIGSLSSGEDITERKQAQETIKESEERLKILFEFAPDAYYLSDLEGSFIDGSRAAEQVMGYKREELVGNNFFKLGLMSPDQAPRAAALLARNTLHQPTGPDEFILNRKDGSQVTVEINTFPVTIKGKALVLGIARDITKRKESEEELRHLSRRLVSLQEDERRMIARELHDEVGQSMTVLKLFLDRASPAEVGGNGTELRAARETLRELMTQIRNISLELRPTMLDDLGLLPTLLWHFKHYTARTHVQVDFKHAGLRRKLPPDVVSTAYRIVQEALTNVARHAQVTEVTVHIHAGRDALVLEIEDRGTGFDTDRKSSRSIGLSSMRERVLALNGRLVVQSIPGKGTSLTAELPLPAKRRKTKKETSP